MDINAFLKENNAAFCIKYDAEADCFSVYRNDEAELSSYDLVNMILYRTDKEYFKSVREEKLLPRMWGQGDTECTVFPLGENEVCCLIYETEIAPLEKISLANRYMKMFRE